MQQLTFSPIRAPQSALSSIPIVDGQLIFSYDTGRVFIDTTSGRFQQCVPKVVIAQNTAAKPGHWYLCSDSVTITLPSIHQQMAAVKVSTIGDTSNVVVQAQQGQSLSGDSSFLLDFKNCSVQFVWHSNHWIIAQITVPKIQVIEQSLSQSGTGQDGKSAYQIAIDNGFIGTQQQWLASLKGRDGASTYQIAVQHGYPDSQSSWLTSLKGSDGKSAYQIAVDNGFIGTQQQWLASLKGQSSQPTIQNNVGAIACLCTQQPQPIFDGMLWVYGGTSQPRYYSVVGGLYCIAQNEAGASLPNGTILIR